jgi:hypothetical protein
MIKSYLLSTSQQTAGVSAYLDDNVLLRLQGLFAVKNYG